MLHCRRASRTHKQNTHKSREELRHYKLHLHPFANKQQTCKPGPPLHTNNQTPQHWSSHQTPNTQQEADSWGLRLRHNAGGALQQHIYGCAARAAPTPSKQGPWLQSQDKAQILPVSCGR